MNIFKNKKGGTFTIFKDKSNGWRFNLKSPNHEIIATSESYKTKQGCLKGIKSIKKYVAKAKIKDVK